MMIVIKICLNILMSSSLHKYKDDPGGGKGEYCFPVQFESRSHFLVRRRDLTEFLRLC